MNTVMLLKGLAMSQQAGDMFKGKPVYYDNYYYSTMEYLQAYAEHYTTEKLKLSYKLNRGGIHERAKKVSYQSQCT